MTAAPAAPAEPERSRWERLTEWPLTAVALLFLAAYAWPILQPGLAPGARTACRVVSWATWAVFVLDYLIRLTLADRPAALSAATCSVSRSSPCRCYGRCGCSGW